MSGIHMSIVLKKIYFIYSQIAEFIQHSLTSYEFNKNIKLIKDCY